MQAVPNTTYACHSLAHTSFPCRNSNCPGSCRWYFGIRQTFALFLGIRTTSHHIRRLCSHSQASLREERTADAVNHWPVSERMSSDANHAITCSSPRRTAGTSHQKPERHPVRHHASQPTFLPSVSTPSRCASISAPYFSPAISSRACRMRSATLEEFILLTVLGVGPLIDLDVLT